MINKEKKKEYNQKYRLENKEKIKEHSQKYYLQKKQQP